MTEEYVANATREFDSERNIRELHQVRIEDTAEKAHWPGSIAPRTAFAILRSASQNGNVKLRDIAGAVVTSVTGEAPAAGAAVRGGAVRVKAALNARRR